MQKMNNASQKNLSPRAHSITKNSPQRIDNDKDPL